MKKAVFIVALVVFLAMAAGAGCGKKKWPPRPFPSVSAGESLPVLAEKYINYPSDKINPPEIEETFQSISNLIEQIELKEVHSLRKKELKSIFDDVVKKSRALTYVQWTIKYEKDCLGRKVCPSKVETEVQRIDKALLFQQDCRLWRLNSIVGLLKERMKIVGKKREAEKIRNSIEGFILNIKKEDPDWKVIAIKNGEYSKYSRRRQR